MDTKMPAAPAPQPAVAEEGGWQFHTSFEIFLFFD